MEETQTQEQPAVTTNLSLPDARKAAAKERMANARAAKKRPSRSTSAEIERLKQMVIDLKEKIPPPNAEVGAPAVAVKKSEIQWFTEVDLNDKGKVASDYPAWYFSVHVDELAEDIRGLENAIEEGVYIGKKKRDALKQLETKKHRYEVITNGKPKLDGPVKDKVARSFNELGEDIKRSMFSYDESWKMTADAHEEATRMVNPCIPIKDDVVGSFAKERGMKVVDGKVSRNDASIIWKCFAKALGEQTDIEHLRRIK
jgi:hypothetical protein